MAILQYILGFILVIVSTFVLYFKWSHGYWKRRNVSYIKPKIPMGNFDNPLFMKKSFDDIVDEACREFKSRGEKIGGVYFFHKPSLLILDLDLIKQVLVKEFQHFRNHGNFIDEKVDPLSGNLLNLEDDKWKNMRAQLSPTFTSGKMKLMFDAMLGCGDQLMEHVSDLCSQKKPLAVKEVISCFGTDVIGTCAFGIECNSFKNPDAEFRKYGRKATEFNIVGTFRQFLGFILPELNKILKMRVFPNDVTDFFVKAFKDVSEQRASTNTKRNDFVQLLLDINAGHPQETAPLSLTQMAAQSFLFFLAGFDTTATNISFCLYELAFHQEIQQRLRDEIFEVLKKYDGNLTYDSLMEMKYMDQVIDETLRLYPSVPLLNRQCTRTYKIPGTNAEIKKGESILINARELHRDERYFPNPEKFDPERFSKENKAKLHPFAHIPFGDGPRVCIGRRFAIMQIKIGLSLLLRKFKVLPHETTPRPVKFGVTNLATWVPDKPILLNTEFYNESL